MRGVGANLGDAPVRGALLLVACLLAGACGGGGSGSGGASSGTPVADAGPDQVATIGIMVTLDGRSSQDPDGDPLTYRWELDAPPSSSATLDGHSTSTPVFLPDVSGTYTATLVVADGQNESMVDVVLVTVPGAGVNVSGQVTFDRVPHNLPSGGLDYTAVSRLPVRGVIVEALSDNGATIGTAVTGDDGRYAVVVPAATTVLIRVRAQMLRTGGPGWDIKVVDNTQSEAIYTLNSTSFNSGIDDSTLDLHAASGWSQSQTRYADVRAAAPFAILDTIYAGLTTVLQADPGLVLPPLKINWSPRNRPSSDFDPAAGEILTTAYFFDPDFAEAYREIFILGDEDADTDEYDAHVIAHEWAHYLEDHLARTDSIGGAHSIVSIVDPRLAFSEGWANAFSAIALGESVYVDSLGRAQIGGFTFDMESNATVNAGWYNESSIHSLIYDIYDDVPDGVDGTALGFAPIFDGLRSWHRDSEAVTSIFSLIPQLKTDFPADAANIDQLLVAQGIVGDGMDHFASNETNAAGSADVLPLYTRLTPDGAPVDVCSIVTFGEYNGLSVRRFLIIDVGTAGDYRIQATGPTGADPDMVLYRRGFVALFDGSGATEDQQRTLDPGRNVLEVYEFSNVSPSIPARGRTCFQVSVQRL